MEPEAALRVEAPAHGTLWAVRAAEAELRWLQMRADSGLTKAMNLRLRVEVEAALRVHLGREFR